ncbi:MAG: hypothetical protein KF696_16180 [Planctomycetes bacterium]|nr:hypothetical protein [Planctomycetota bacterium]MCW8137273.1 hypothetical protein [Planctomycetota bacterium]
MKRFLLAVVAIGVACTVVLAAARATLDTGNVGMGSESSPIFISSAERLKIEYAGGIKVRVYGDGILDPPTATREWFAVAQDGAWYRGQIVDADPRWEVVLTWSGYVYAYGDGSGNSIHWALAATWGAVTGDVSDHWGREVQVKHDYSGSASYSTTYGYEDESGYVQFSATGSGKTSGGYEIIPTAHWVHIDKDDIEKAELKFRMRNKGWMVLSGNTSTTKAETRVMNGMSYGHWDGVVRAWDAGNPNTPIQSWTIE